MLEGKPLWLLPSLPFVPSSYPKEGNMKGYVRYNTSALWAFLVESLKEFAAAGGKLSEELTRYAYRAFGSAPILSKEGKRELISIMELIAAAHGVDATGWQMRYLDGALSRGAETLLVGFKAGALVEIFSIGVLANPVQHRYVWIEFDSIQQSVEYVNGGGEEQRCFAPNVFHSSEWKSSLAPLNDVEDDRVRRIIEPGCISCFKGFTLKQLLGQEDGAISYRDRFNGDSRWGYELHCESCG